jgi:dihydrofolate synthase/folylpolyglutamate synthase
VQKRYNYEKDYRAAFTQLQDHLGANDILIVSGSFYLVSAILNWKGNNDAGTGLKG